MLSLLPHSVCANLPSPIILLSPTSFVRYPPNTVLPDKGYTVADPNLDELYQVYSQPGHAYWVVEYEGEVVGGGGIAPLTGSESDICELQKMYFLPAIRGKGLAKKLALMAMEQAREMGFKRCYLETTAFLKEAIALYEHLGFEHIDYALGCTGHVDCEVRMLRKL